MSENKKRQRKLSKKANEAAELSAADHAMKEGDMLFIFVIT